MTNTGPVTDPLADGEESQPAVASGTLGPAGRRAAIAAALGLVGRYLATGSQALEPSAALGWRDRADDEDLSPLLATLRLRVALAAADTLCGLLRKITKRPTFRYQQRTIDSTGELSGQLDVNRYIANLGTYSEALSFPVLDVYRSVTTPENVLAVYAAQWLVGELRSALRASGAPTNGPEYRAWIAADRALQQQMNSPELASCRNEALIITRRNLQRRQINAVHQRLRRGEIANQTPYAGLLRWVEHVLARDPIAEPGDVEWAMYGERFDTKLFELWCLHQLGSELANTLNYPKPEVEHGWRTGSPTYRFEGFYGSIEVYFQRRLGDHEPYKAAWSLAENAPLFGTPDIMVVATPVAGTTKTLILDPKLKQRSGRPTDDIYKVLGYFKNFPIDPPAGFVLSHTTSSVESSATIYRDQYGGILGVAELNPAAKQSITSCAFKPVIESILTALGQQPPPHPPLDDSGHGDTTLPQEYANRVANWLLDWGQKHPAEVATVENRIQAAVGTQCWQAIPHDVQTMIATADYIGYNLSGGDFSGPVIGLGAAVEYLLHSQVINPAIETANKGERNKLDNATKTFGSAINALEVAATNSHNQFFSPLRERLKSARIDLQRVASLAPVWRELNTAYRRPAAHRELVSQKSWQDAYFLVIGRGALLAKTVETLNM